LPIEMGNVGWNRQVTMFWPVPVFSRFDYRKTNGFVEGKNKRINAIKRIPYGSCNTVTSE